MNPRQLLNFDLTSYFLKKKTRQKSNSEVLEGVKIKGLKEVGH